MPVDNLGQANDVPQAATQSSGGARWFGIWPAVWLGTVLAGAIFGLLLGLLTFADEGFAAAIFGALFGAALGFLFAAVVATFIVPAVTIADRAIGLRRLRPILASLAGGMTGVLSALPVACDDLRIVPTVTPIITALFGAMGAWIAAMMWTKRTEGWASHTVASGICDVNTPIVNRIFRLGLLVAAIAFVSVVCIGVICAVHQAREASRRRHCENNLKQIALALHNYEISYGRLPPVYMTNQAGKRVPSWRVNVARLSHYNAELARQMDFNEPWNSPKNAKFLAGYSAGSSLHCPSSGKNSDSPLTDYVAVVGPNTLWPGETSRSLAKRPRAILVVEWPKSDIHWAEPRDVTVEEFLDWFRKKPRDVNSFHPHGLLYVDAQGNVGELPNDADPETVRKLLSGE